MQGVTSALTQNTIYIQWLTLSYSTFVFFSFTHLKFNKRGQKACEDIRSCLFNQVSEWMCKEIWTQTSRATNLQYNFVSSQWKEMSHGNSQNVFMPNTWTEAKCEGKSTNFSTCVCAACLVLVTVNKPFFWWSQTWCHTAYISGTGGREEKEKQDVTQHAERSRFICSWQRPQPLGETLWKLFPNVCSLNFPATRGSTKLTWFVVTHKNNDPR